MAGVITVTGPSSPPCSEEKKTAPVAKILLVEDNEMNRDMLSRRLQRKGYEVVLAEDGGQGLSLAQKETPDVILLDMSLPVIDGWQAARELKGNPATRAIPIIALTAHAMSGDRERALEAGCDDYDTKPVEMPRLLGKIEALLDKKPAAT
jgi:CheY-like chemotaxis protein